MEDFLYSSKLIFVFTRVQKLKTMNLWIKSSFLRLVPHAHILKKGPDT